MEDFEDLNSQREAADPEATPDQQEQKLAVARQVITEIQLHMLQ